MEISAKEVLEDIGEEQADISTLEREAESKGLKSKVKYLPDKVAVKSEKKYIAMDNCQIAMIATDSEEVKRAFALDDYEFDGRTRKEPNVKEFQKVVVPYIYIRDFVLRIERTRTSIKRLEKIEIGDHLEINVAKDRPLKLALRLKNEDKERIGEIVLWLAPRIETPDRVEK